MRDSSIISAVFGLLGLSQQPLVSEHLTSSQTPVGDISWKNLNATLGGKLFESASTSGPCARLGGASAVFSSSVIMNGTSSNEVKLTQWEECRARAARGGNDGFYIHAKSAHDVSETLRFVRETGVPLVTENLPSEFCASPTPNAVALLTKDMRKVDFEHNFRAQQCAHVSPTSAITFEPGAQLAHIYTIADRNKVTFIGSTIPSLFGGEGKALADATSVLAPTYGSLIDNILEVEVVTPEGRIRTVNPCLERDLWFALRGGGNAFGIITKVSVKAHPKVTLQTFGVVFKSPLDLADAKFILNVAAHYALQWAKEGWGGYITPKGIFLTTPTLSKEEAKHSIAPLMEVVQRMGSNVKEKHMTTHDGLMEFVKFFSPRNLISPNAEFALSSRLIGEDMFASMYGKDDLVKAITTASTYVDSWTVSLSVPYGFESSDETSLTPAFYNSPWMVYYTEPISSGLDKSDALLKYSAVGKAANYLRFITPDAGAYYAQADRSEPHFDLAFWANNYERLMKIKETYDPRNTMRAWQSVGWTGPSSDARYTCHTRAKVQVVRCDRRCR